MQVTKNFVPFHLHVLLMLFLLDLLVESININAHHSMPGVEDPGLPCSLCRPSPLRSLHFGLVYRQIQFVHFLKFK